MRITSEIDRINYLPDSILFAWLEEGYSTELEYRVNGNPHDVTAEDLVSELENDNYDPFESDYRGVEDSDLTALWADLAYPLPTDADELAIGCYGTTPSDIAREALREYAIMFDVESVAERVLDRLRAEWDEDNNNN